MFFKKSAATPQTIVGRDLNAEQLSEVTGGSGSSTKIPTKPGIPVKTPVAIPTKLPTKVPTKVPTKQGY